MPKQGDISVREAGRKGGETTSERYGHEFYEEIGKKGGQRGGPRVRDLIQKGKRQEK